MESKLSAMLQDQEETSRNLLAAESEVKRQRALVSYAAAGSEGFLQAKKHEAKIVLQSLFGDAQPDMPVWALRMQQSLAAVQETLIVMQQAILQLGEQITSLSAAVRRIDSRLIRIENRYSFTNTNERFLQEICNSSGVFPSSADLPTLVNAADLEALPSDATKDYLRFYGLRVLASAEKNKSTLKTHLGVPQAP
ncbi:hypothetical protein MDAP_002332 [Mitosporidium daphniae]|uniref:Mug135-like C-terminal domain-containing protein n=1 Tax=Mitosporidium daphniae TaxID=1485682 RepID=A0A098VSE3_9MICR|nr:uncharacterized protein DI09_28p200 [Mitosporidium daphniae]KGG51739.1 hypothetical protein DI09_28p200 [Mitosporidium daphniae]|eukprot:XP_013238167.1 uncharacterized protein DI09_28p200 [Mitosporidium daphniae]